MQLLLKMLSGMANSVDPDQTAPASAILLETLVYEILGHLLYSSFTIKILVYNYNANDPHGLTR